MTRDGAPVTALPGLLHPDRSLADLAPLLDVAAMLPDG